MRIIRHECRERAGETACYLDHNLSISQQQAYGLNVSLASWYLMELWAVVIFDEQYHPWSYFARKPVSVNSSGYPMPVYRCFLLLTHPQFRLLFPAPPDSWWKPVWSYLSGLSQIIRAIICVAPACCVWRAAITARVKPCVCRCCYKGQSHLFYGCALTGRCSGESMESLATLLQCLMAASQYVWAHG